MANNKYTIAILRPLCKKLNLKLLSKEYSQSNLKVRCLTCNEISYKNVYNLTKKPTRCKYCAAKSANDYRKPSLKKLKKEFKKGGCKLLLKSITEYINCETRMPYICSCGREASISFSNFKRGHRCLECSRLRRSRFGEAHAQYTGLRPKLVALRDSNRHKRWSNKVRKRDNYTCQCCGKRGGSVHAHHQISFAKCKKLRFSVHNGITFCVKCHNAFHSVYGNVYNTDKQVIQFITNYDKGLKFHVRRRCTKDVFIRYVKHNLQAIYEIETNC